MSGTQTSRQGTADDVKPWVWLEATKELQRETYGIDYDALHDDALADYITWNTTALVAEIGELLNEVGWKVWAQPRGWVHHDQARGELVDMLHFVANIAVALGITDDELWRHYRRKMQVNADRQREGYDGVTGKCPRCGRDTDEILPVRAEGFIFCVCGERLRREHVTS